MLNFWFANLAHEHRVVQLGRQPNGGRRAVRHHVNEEQCPLDEGTAVISPDGEYTFSEKACIQVFQLFRHQFNSIGPLYDVVVCFCLSFKLH